MSGTKINLGSQRGFWHFPAPTRREGASRAGAGHAGQGRGRGRRSLPWHATVRDGAAGHDVEQLLQHGPRKGMRAGRVSSSHCPQLAATAPPAGTLRHRGCHQPPSPPRHPWGHRTSPGQVEGLPPTAFGISPYIPQHSGPQESSWHLSYPHTAPWSECGSRHLLSPFPSKLLCTQASQR